MLSARQRCSLACKIDAQVHATAPARVSDRESIVEIDGKGIEC